MIGDDRTVVASYVMGEAAYRRPDEAVAAMAHSNDAGAWSMSEGVGGERAIRRGR
jgi:hypothetical protein